MKQQSDIAVIEEQVLSIMIRNSECVLGADIEPEDFSDEWARKVYRAMRSIVTAGGDIDVFTLKEQVGGAQTSARLSRLYTDVVAAKRNLPAYIEMITDARKKTRLREIIGSASNDTARSAVEIAGDLVSQLSALQTSRRGTAFDSNGMMRKVVDYLDVVMEHKKRNEPVGLPTGIEKLDRVLGGMHKSDMVVVGARPGVGKTAFALTIAINAALRGKSVGFVSTEMGIEQIGMRVTSLLSHVTASSLRDCSFEQDEWTRIIAAANRIKGIPFNVLDMPSCRVSDIVMQARTWAATGGLDLLIVDYLTRLVPESHGENRALAVGEMASQLKTLARTLNIPVMVLAQLSREVQKRQRATPILSDLRDSGMIEQEADQVMMLYRPHVNDNDADPSEAEIIVAKNRHGEVATLLLAFDPLTMRWADKEHRYSDEYDR